MKYQFWSKCLFFSSLAFFHHPALSEEATVRCLDREPGTWFFNEDGDEYYVLGPNELQVNQEVRDSVRQFKRRVCTSHVTNLDRLFSRLGGVISEPTPSLFEPLKNWDTSNVISMKETFSELQLSHYYGYFLPLLPLENWDTSKVTSMRAMFASVFSPERGLLRLDNILKWDTSKVTDMSDMFVGTWVDLKGIYWEHNEFWDTSSVTNMRGMFFAARTFSILNVHMWDVSNVKDMGYMFNSSWVLSPEDLSGWNTANVTDMRYMFANTDYKKLGISNWNVSKVTDMKAMFWSSKKFNESLNAWQVENVVDHQYFAEDSSLQNENWPIFLN